MIWLFGLIGFALLLVLFLNQKTFGRHPAGARLKRIMVSPLYSGKVFQNVHPTEVLRKEARFADMMNNYIHKPSTVKPATALPALKTNLKTLADDKPVFVWFGHSSYLLKYKGWTLLTDPVFSGYASPVPIFGKAFPAVHEYTVDDFDFVDVMLLTHDHYDHLDYKTVLKLKDKVGVFCTSLGVGEHLERWGVPVSKIIELEWWQEAALGSDRKITATPARHFSGRKFKRAGTLWSSFVLELGGYRFFLGGDSGYDDSFTLIGSRFGPFDCALLECGQYGKDWPDIHMMPEQTLQAATDLGCSVLIPVHWAKFQLSIHSWNEPIERLLQANAGSKINIATPRIGEPVVTGGSFPSDKWWT